MYEIPVVSPCTLTMHTVDFEERPAVYISHLIAIADSISNPNSPNDG